MRSALDTLSELAAAEVDDLLARGAALPPADLIALAEDPGGGPADDLPAAPAAAGAP